VRVLSDRRIWLIGCVAVGLGLAAPQASLAALEPDAVIGAGYYPVAVNDDGQVAVNSYTHGGASEAASIWNPDGSGSGTFMELQPLYAGGFAEVFAMNAKGESVGDSQPDDKKDSAPTLWSATGEPTNLAPSGLTAEEVTDEEARSISPEGVPGGSIFYCKGNNTCQAPTPAMGDPLELVGPTGVEAGSGAIASMNGSEQGVGEGGIFTLGSHAFTPFSFVGFGIDIFEDGGFVAGQDIGYSYAGIVYVSPSEVVEHIPCGEVTASGGANEYGDVVTVSTQANKQYVWHSGVCYSLESVEPASLLGWTFPSLDFGAVINELGQIAAVGYPPESATATAVFFTPQYPHPPAYQLTGVVKTPSGQPASGVTVQVLRENGTAVTPGVATEANGSYLSTLNAGDYTVSAGAGDSIASGSECVSATATTCTIKLTANRTVNFTQTETGSGGTGSSTGSSSSSGSPGSTGSGTPGGTSNAPPGGTVKIGGASASGTSASALVSCVGASGSTCTISVSLYVTETLKGGKVVAVSAKTNPKKTTKRTVDLGTTTVTLKAGESQKVTVKLNGAGQGLLKSHHTLAVKLTEHSGASVLAGPTVTFKAPTSKTQAKKH